MTEAEAPAQEGASEGAFVEGPLDGAAGMVQVGVMQPARMEVIGDELAVSWDQGGESFIKLEQLRRACPCAGCSGEPDILGNIHRAPPAPLSPQSFRIRKLEPVGGYAFRPIWEDGHSSGLYSWDYLHRVGQHAK